jgi:hypothetical protein
MSRKTLIAPLFAAALLATTSTGCQTTGVGQVEVALSSARPDASDVTSVIVVVKQIDFEVRGAGWVPVVTRPQTIDLLALDGKDLTSLGVGTLPTGRVKAIRFLLDDAGAKVILKGGKQAKLELPDRGVLKVKGSFHLGSCASGTVIVDFDPKLHAERNRRTGETEYELRCKARVKTVSTPNGCGGGTTDGGSAPDGGASDPCKNVVCAPGETCEDGVCVADPCFNVVCPPGERCEEGICVSSSGGTPDMGGGSSGGGSSGGGCRRH